MKHSPEMILRPLIFASSFGRMDDFVKPVYRDDESGHKLIISRPTAMGSDHNVPMVSLNFSA